MKTASVEAAQGGTKQNLQSACTTECSPTQLYDPDLAHLRKSWRHRRRLGFPVAPQRGVIMLLGGTRSVPLQPDLNRDLRELWRHCLRRGRRLPAEHGIDGGKP